LRDRLIHSRFFDVSDPRGAASSVSLLAGGMRSVKLGGNLPSGWCGNLMTSLSRAGISVTRGFAKRVSDEGWIAEFQIQAAGAGADSIAIDYLSMARSQPPPGPPAEIALDSYYVDASPESGQYLFLEVHGYDRVGFLASLLDRLAHLSLLPEQISLETWEGRALDCFHLKAAGGGPPRAATARELAAMLEALRVPERRGSHAGEGMASAI
jgi:hypothetical protein